MNIEPQVTNQIPKPRVSINVQPKNYCSYEIHPSLLLKPEIKIEQPTNKIKIVNNSQKIENKVRYV